MTQFIANEDPNAPPPSIGFPCKYTSFIQAQCSLMLFTHLCYFRMNQPVYIYPDTFGDGGPCDIYNGTACTATNATGACCYNIEQWCPDYLNNDGDYQCDRYDRGAYPTGDKRHWPDQMTDYDALAPFPNAIFWNWATIFILAFGNLGALDFQAR